MRRLIILLAFVGQLSAQTFINSNYVETGTPGSSLGVALASTVASRWLVATVEIWGAGAGNVGCLTVTDSQSNAWFRANRVYDAGNDHAGDIWYAENIAGTGTDTITCTLAARESGTMSIGAEQYSGMPVSGTLDRTVTAIGSGQSASSGATAATSQANELVIGFASWLDCGASGFGIPGAGAGFTARQTSNCSVSNENILEDKVVAVTGAQTATATANHSTDTQWIALVATFRAIVAAPPVANVSGYSPALAPGCSFFVEGEDIGATAHVLTGKCSGVTNNATAVNSDFTRDTNFLAGRQGIQGDGTRYATLSRNDFVRTFLYIGRVNDQVFNSNYWCVFYNAVSGGNLANVMCPQKTGFGADYEVPLANDSNVAIATAGTIPNGGPPCLITGSITGTGPFTLTLRINRVTVATTILAGSLPTVTSSGVFAGYNTSPGSQFKGSIEALFLGTTGFDPAGIDMANLERWAEAKYFPGFTVAHQFVYCGFDSVYTQFPECQYSDDMVNYTRYQTSPAAFGAHSGHTERDEDYFFSQGKWWKVHTGSDASPNPERFFGLDVSTDEIGGLFHHVKDIACPNPGGGVECWAPSHFTDLDGSVHVFATVGHDGVAHIPYEFHPTTSDLAGTWSAGFQIPLSGAPSANNIDAFNFRVGARYYMMLKDYDGGPIWIYSSPTVTGTYVNLLQITASGYEGPSMCQKPGGGWRVFLDQGFASQWYQDVKQDLSATTGAITANTMNNSTGSAVTYPFYATGYNEHGTCMNLSGAQGGASK